MSVKPDWKRNLDAVGAFLGSSAPAKAAAPDNVPGAQVSEAGGNLLKLLASVGSEGAALDEIAERIKMNYRDMAAAAKPLEDARLIVVSREGLVPMVRLTDAGHQIAATMLSSQASD